MTEKIWTEAQRELRKRELEDALEGHKRRFLEASRKGFDAVQADLSPLNWITAYPMQTALLAFAGGLLLGISKPLDPPRIHSLR